MDANNFKKIDLTNSENLILILNKVKNGEVISIEEINLLKQALTILLLEHQSYYISLIQINMQFGTVESLSS